MPKPVVSSLTTSVRSLPEDLRIVSNLELALKEAKLVLLVTPSTYVRQTVQSIRPYLEAGAI